MKQLCQPGGDILFQCGDACHDILHGFRRLILVEIAGHGDLVAHLGLLGCISSFQPDYGNKFLTYAAPAIHNAMLDYIRRLNPTFEAKNLDCIIRLDEVKKGENKGQHEFIADSRVQNPEQIFIAKETHEEIHTALEMIDEREKAYLWYRFGFEDDVLHPLSETAKHFHLSESRAKSTEKLALDNFWLELPWWY